MGIDLFSERECGLRQMCGDAVAKSRELGFNSFFNTFHCRFEIFEGGCRLRVVLDGCNRIR